MKKFLVIGDSYAQLDSDHSHWFQLWANRCGHSVTFGGLEGGNPVNIAVQLQQHNLQNHDGVIYHFTSLLRGEGICTPTQQSTRDSTVMDLMNRSFTSDDDSGEWLEHCLSGSVESAVTVDGEYRYHAQNVVPYFYNPVNGVDTDIIDDHTATMANDFYRSVSTRWLVRANWLAYENTVQKLSLQNLSTVVALPPCGGFDFVETATVQPHVKTWNMCSEKQLAPLSHSNHISKSAAEFFADRFENFVQKHSIFI